MKSVIFSDEAREKMKRGVDLIANSVKVTLGPCGRNMVYGFHYGYPVSTKDGVTVARQVEAKDPAEQLGLLLIRQAAQKTADDAGDGTTTATILAQELFTEGLKVIKSGANLIMVKRGIDLAVDEVLAYLETQKKEITTDDELIKVATLSANNDKKIGELINYAVSEVGKEGVITIEDNYQASETVVEVVNGMKLLEGLVSPWFVTDQVKMDASYQNPYLMIVDTDIHHIGQIKGILETALNSGRPVVIMANSMHGTVLQNLVQSKIKHNLQLAVVKSPYFGDFRTEQLTDLAVLTGGKVIGPATGLRLEDVKIEDLGNCESIQASKSSTTVISNNGDSDIVSGRIASIKQAIEHSESDYEKQKLQERLSKLTTGVAVIKVGAPTEVEQKEKKMRIEDALLASKAAIEEGVIPGGGVALLWAIDAITEQGREEELIGRRIVKRALKSPIRQIAENAGLEGAEIIAAILSGPKTIEGPVADADALTRKIHSYGYNFLTGEYGDLIEMGVIDPLKVVKAALINAASVAGTMLTTEVLCNEEVEPEITRTPKPKSA